MWPYFGAKTELVDLYPPPIHGTIIEPFAGTAIYSWKYWDREIILYDKYKEIINIWEWLRSASPADIIGLPRPAAGQKLKELNFPCDAALKFMGFCCGYGYKHPAHIASPHLVKRPNFTNYRLEKIAANVHKIRNWKFFHASYQSAPNIKATWFVDPPYQRQGKGYKHGSGKIDYVELGKYCKSRYGQVIVCEGNPAQWLPFEHLKDETGCNGKKYQELLYYQVDQEAKRFVPLQGVLF